MCVVCLLWEVFVVCCKCASNSVEQTSYVAQQSS
jgi:hypothetical protein